MNQPQIKKQFLSLLMIIFTLHSYAQLSYEKGYFINNGNEKVDCLIQNVGWNFNPSEIEYKLTDNSDKRTFTITDLKEFGIYNICKYVRQIVKIDNSKDDLNDLSKSRDPIFWEKEVFLKVLVEGKANLYSYKNANSTKYFYFKDSSEIEQLVSKMYLNKDNKIAYNNSFRQQLWTELKCPNFNIAKVENIDYNSDELINYFVDYNECYDHEFINFEKKQKTDWFHLTLRPGINTSSLYIENGISQVKNVRFDNELTFRFGVEAEFVMSFYKNKLAIIIEPTYQYFKSEKDITAYFVTQTVKVDYKSIELPIGVRYYMFLNAKSKFFINAAIVVDFSGDSVIDYEISDDLVIKTSSNISLGVGYKYNNKLSLEYRHQAKRQVLKNYVNWENAYKTGSVILGYTLF